MVKLIFNKSISTELKKTIRAVFDETVRMLGRYYKIRAHCDVYFALIKSKPNRGFITAWADGSDAIIISFYENRAIDEKELMMVLVHELNHVKRYENFPIPEHETLFDNILIEGLALAFEKEFVRDWRIGRWPDHLRRKTLSDEEFYGGLRQVIEVGDGDFDRYDWMYNLDHGSDLPENYGYRIGRKLVLLYCLELGVSAAQALDVPNEEFLKFARRITEEYYA